MIGGCKPLPYVRHGLAGAWSNLCQAARGNAPNEPEKRIIGARALMAMSPPRRAERLIADGEL